MASAAGDLMCVFCFQPGADMSDPRKLLCGHVGCFSCIEHACKAAKELECPSCRFKCQEVDVNKLEIVAYRPSLSEGNDKLMCGICYKPAKVFCVKCQKLLCAMHHKDDNERTISGGYAVHHHVKTGVYATNKDLYIRHYCRRHSEKKTIQACNSCLDTFCRSCDATVKCSTTNDLHKLTSLPDMVAILRLKVNELKASLEERSAKCQSLLKVAYKEAESFEKMTTKMLEKVERIMKEQIEQIKLEAEKLKDEITNYKEECNKTTEENVERFVACYGQAAEGLVSLNTAASIASAGHMLESYSLIESRIKATLNMDLTPAHITRKHLVPTGIFRRLEVRLYCPDLRSIEHMKTEENGSDTYNSVRWIAADRLVSASSGGVELRDRELNVIQSIKMPNVLDVIIYNDALLVLQLLDDKTKSIQLYSMKLVKIRDIVSFSTEEGLLSQIAVVDGKLVASDSVHKCLHVWTLEGKHITKIDLTDVQQPRGVCITSDGCVLISNFVVKGCIRKYSLGGDYQLVWKSDHLKNPRAIAESEFGDLFVIKWQSKKYALYQLSSNGKLLRTVTCDHLRQLHWLGGVSVIDDCLAAACSKEGIKLFQLTCSA